MDRISFQNKVREMSEKKPRLFALESDAKVDIEKIEDVKILRHNTARLL